MSQPSLWDGFTDEEAICCAECGFRRGHSSDCDQDFFPACLGRFDAVEDDALEEAGLAPICVFLRESAFPAFATWSMEPHFAAFREGKFTIGYISPYYRKGLKP
jgi:hypothetical protein